MTLFNSTQVNEYISNLMDEHTDLENPDDYMENKELRVLAVSVLQLACAAGLISQEESQQGMNLIVARTHPELREEYFGTYGKRIRDESE
jgi:hypothetical protein